MPLWPYTVNAFIRVITESKNVLVRSCWIDAMSAVHLPSTPELTCEYLLITSHDSLISEDNETAVCHNSLEDVQD